MVSGETVAAVSQLFYAHRIHILSGKKLIPGVVTGVSPKSTLSLMFSTASVIFSSPFHNLPSEYLSPSVATETGPFLGNYLFSAVFQMQS
jgi:hypothetical protein